MASAAAHNGRPFIYLLIILMETLVTRLNEVTRMPARTSTNYEPAALRWELPIAAVAAEPVYKESVTTSRHGHRSSRGGLPITRSLKHSAAQRLFHIDCRDAYGVEAPKSVFTRVLSNHIATVPA
jgi:hypothetical protein